MQSITLLTLLVLPFHLGFGYYSNLNFARKPFLSLSANGNDNPFPFSKRTRTTKSSTGKKRGMLSTVANNRYFKRSERVPAKADGSIKKFTADFSSKENMFEVPKSASTTLPQNWKVFRDENSGREYFFNKESGETTWERPIVVDAAESAENGGVVKQKNGRDQQQQLEPQSMEKQSMEPLLEKQSMEPQSMEKQSMEQQSVQSQPLQSQPLQSQSPKESLRVTLKESLIESPKQLPTQSPKQQSGAVRRRRDKLLRGWDETRSDSDDPSSGPIKINEVVKQIKKVNPFKQASVDTPKNALQETSNFISSTIWEAGQLTLQEPDAMEMGEERKWLFGATRALEKSVDLIGDAGANLLSGSKSGSSAANVLSGSSGRDFIEEVDQVVDNDFSGGALVSTKPVISTTLFQALRVLDISLFVAKRSYDAAVPFMLDERKGIVGNVGRRVDNAFKLKEKSTRGRLRSAEKSAGKIL